jgi:hypothetical protein
MLRRFLSGLAAHLAPGGEGWLVLSDSPSIWGCERGPSSGDGRCSGPGGRRRIDARPQHSRVADTSDPLHAARAAEVTSLWRLAPQSA